MGLDHVRLEIERMRVQVGRQRREILLLQKAGIGVIKEAAEMAKSADPKAAPLWREVSSGTTAIWHDHRAHFMGNEDPPEVRLARELEQRRQRLAVEQKELEMLEEKLRKKMERDEH